MANKTLYITVNTTEDFIKPRQGLTTLRQAIVKLNEKQGNWDRAYINFDLSNADSASPWFIAPEWPLPPILYGNVYINYVDPKNVIISGEKLNPDAKDKNFDGFAMSDDYRLKTIHSIGHNKRANPHSSLLTIGDSDDLNKAGPTRRFKGPVVLQNINFIDNFAIGEDGQSPQQNNHFTGQGGGGGGGGGLAAGAGISIVSDVEVQIFDSVFQNLEVKGGQGSEGNNRSGSPFKSTGRGFSGLWGGGPGSFVSSPWSSEKTKGFNGVGGYGGDKDEAWDRNQLSYLNGERGDDAFRYSYPAPFGVGGGGGGGGGKGSSYEYLWREYAGVGGNGGNGGHAGFGGGSGGGGGGGRGGGEDGKYAKGGKAGDAFRFGPFLRKPLGEDGGKKTGFLEEHKGGKGGDGLSLGGGIAVLNSRAKLHLERVDFIDIRAKNFQEGRFIYVINDDKNNKTYAGVPRKGTVTGSNIKTYEANDRDGKDVPLGVSLEGYTSLITPKGWMDIRAFITEKNYKSSADNFFHKGISYVRETDKARIRDSFINLKSLTPEVVSVKYERPKSLMRNIEIDSRGLEAEINDIYKKIIPVEDPQDIRNRMYKKILTAAVGPIADVWSSRSSSNQLMKASRGQFSSSDKSFNIGVAAGLSAAKFAYSTVSAINEYQEEIRQNNANIKELAEKTKPNRNLVSAKPINVGTSRSVVRIDNFTIGEDVLYLEGFTKDYGPKFTIGPLSQGGDSKNLKSIEIHTSNKANQGNAATRIAELTFDPGNVKFTNDPLAYLESLTTWDNASKRWVINTMVTKTKESSQITSGGPAGELIILERPLDVPYTQEWKVTTQNYDDIVLGTDGNESISTSGGNDQIFPGLGRDTISGGSSFDWVNYLDIQKPIHVVGGVSDDPNNPKSISQHDVSFLNIDDENRELKATLAAVESISAFGASKFDMKNLPIPSGVKNSNETAYVVRTGSGSQIDGSTHSDHFIVSFMEDENSSEYLSTSPIKIRPVDVSDKTRSYQMLDSPSIISGGGGDDQLTFAYDTDSPDLEMVEVRNVDENLKGFQAIVQDNQTIVAFVKDIESNNIKIASDSEHDEKFVLKHGDIVLNVGSMLREDYKTVKESGELDFEQINSQIDESGQEVNGTGSSDGLTGTPESDAFSGFGGDDHFDSGNGSDLLDGGSGNDKLHGMSGRDIIRGGKGHDYIDGGKHGDLLHGHVGNDVILGGDGKDYVHGGKHHDSLRGHSGNDYLFGNAGKDIIVGGKGDDFIAGGKGLNRVKGGKGSDTFYLQHGGRQIIEDFDPNKDKIVFSSDLDRDLIQVNAGNQVVYDGTIIAEL